MGSRRLRPEEWPASPQTRIYTRSAGEPRDEQLRFPKSAQKTRPTPINIAPGQRSPLLDSPPFSQRSSAESPRDPEIVDLAAPTTWPRRAPAKPRNFPKRIASPSVASQRSARQSEISFGILDYYIGEPSPLHSPNLPPPTPKLPGTPRAESPVVDPAIEKFDFGLTPKSLSQRAQCDVRLPGALPDTKAGVQQDESSKSPPQRPEHPQVEQKAIDERRQCTESRSRGNEPINAAM
ncbi:hypothetical protein LTR37_018895 [Vermiconidia calcicola]|uniref:Uncharacterized protein n=1 Tax=Vermiconidia calcicola TaxID=1690605 RepID=A0ACC3MHJ4_9PEZI|nr:hypothetical protein LTR37_018895 [Vermiconidia calcicola]